ncbi:hypothetical protein G6F46_002587 [Rhizopus delemar]|uniref:Uncharacterized protein n=2 Tax=Rhizopus TaxID=4842 RepID=A0A9P6Z8V4_9FUNG|nr:hypothetical protein G6F55_002130 [Rhizopus delemar]KAG1547679.1 hypothetical protein G6F51_004122 [Rhizopus arrhizus]KAG1500973.1 hypothetical protein G6F54_003356 [Rhizopus delemar]KAG1514621.1 hypothetical protein G6F53_003537 [Rhizopus delemar]KAG1528302.1 hypothetical protein G6F52_000764 [Rhizopus delemar]
MRRYSQPVPVSAATSLHYRQFKNSSSVSSTIGSIPDPIDLLKIKADLEALLPISEKRIHNLQKDLILLRKNIKTKPEVDQKQYHIPTLIKDEIPDAKVESLHVAYPTHNKQQLERQLALETLRKKRRRDESITNHVNKKPTQLVKLKRADENALPTCKKSHTNVKKKKAAESHDKEDELDFVRVKPKDQVPILSFWATIDPHFRPLEEADREFLLEKPDDETSHIIPPLGRHYTETWSEDDSISIPGMSLSPSTSSSSRQGSHDHVKYSSKITEDQLLKEEVSCGALTERLLSSLIPDKDNDIAAEDQDEECDRLDFQEELNVGDFEERLMTELRYVGLFAEDDIEWDAKEDDEICAELRAISKELKEQHAINETRKKKLLNVVDNQLQYEQYRHVLDTLDVQVEQCYLKRFRTQKSKKRKNAPASGKSSLSEHAIHAMNKRKAWIDALENIFKDKNLVMPTKSIYEES